MGILSVQPSAFAADALRFFVDGLLPLVNFRLDGGAFRREAIQFFADLGDGRLFGLLLLDLGQELFAFGLQSCPLGLDFFLFGLEFLLALEQLGGRFGRLGVVCPPSAFQLKPRPSRSTSVRRRSNSLLTALSACRSASSASRACSSSACVRAERFVFLAPFFGFRVPLLDGPFDLLDGRTIRGGRLRLGVRRGGRLGLFLRGGFAAPFARGAVDPGEEGTQDALFGRIDRLADPGEFAEVHPMQHFPVEVGRPRDVVANGRRRVEGDGRRVGHLFGRRLRVVRMHRREAGRGGVDRRVRRIGRVRRCRIAVFVAADQDDRPDGRLFGLGDAFGRRFFA